MILNYNVCILQLLHYQVSDYKKKLDHTSSKFMITACFVNTKQQQKLISWKLAIFIVIF